MVLTQKNRSQSFYIYHCLPSLQIHKSPKKKESRSTTDYCKASYTELMVLHRKYVLMCACVFQFREREFDIITQLPHSQEDSKQIKQCEHTYLWNTHTYELDRPISKNIYLKLVKEHKITFLHMISVENKTKEAKLKIYFYLEIMSSLRGELTHHRVHCYTFQKDNT